MAKVTRPGSELSAAKLGSELRKQMNELNKLVKLVQAGYAEGSLGTHRVSYDTINKLHDLQSALGALGKEQLKEAVLMAKGEMVRGVRASDEEAPAMAKKLGVKLSERYDVPADSREVWTVTGPRDKVQKFVAWAKANFGD